MTIETKIVIDEADPVAVWTSQTEELKKASTGTREQRLKAVLTIQVISHGMAVLFPTEEDRLTPKYQELKAHILNTLDEIGQVTAVENTQKQAPKNWLSRLGF